MKRVFWICLVFSLPGLAEAAEDRGSAELILSGAEVSVSFGRPELKGRDILSLARPGMVWRLGMNKATLLSSSTDLDFAGVRIPKGEYSLFAKKRGEDDWVLLVHSNTGLWGTSGYDPANDVAEIPLLFARTQDSEESLSIRLEKQSETKAQLVVQWGDTQLRTAFQIAQ